MTILNLQGYSIFEYYKAVDESEQSKLNKLNKCKRQSYI